VEQSVDLMEVGDEVGEFITVRSLELLIQWLHIGRVVVGKISPRGEIDAIVEFVRCDWHGEHDGRTNQDLDSCQSAANRL